MRGEKKVYIRRVSDGEASTAPDLVAVEEPLPVYVNGEEYATLQYTPPMAVELAVGYLASEGLIAARSDIKSLALRRGGVFVETETKPPAARPRASTITSGCGGGMVSHVSEALAGLDAVAPGFTVGAERIFALSDVFRKKSELFERTGGVHSAAIADADGILVFADDIGRHNAVDKVLGVCLLEEIPTADKVLLSTGRVSSEILVKAARRGIPVIASRSAPTAMAVEYAERLGITLIGFLRGRRMNVYTHPEVILTGA